VEGEGGGFSEMRSSGREAGEGISVGISEMKKA
jgi:hypothetical protein